MIDLEKKPTKRGLFAMNQLYQKGMTFKSLRVYFAPYLAGMTRPTANKFFLFLLAIISIQWIQTVRFCILGF